MATRKRTGEALSVQSFPGVTLGTVTALPAHEIPDQAAVYLQDIVLDQAPQVRRRGKLLNVSHVAFSNPGVGIVSCYDPAGTLKIAIIDATGSAAHLCVLSSDYQSKTNIALHSDTNPISTTPYPIVDAKAMLGGGSLIGISKQYDGMSQDATTDYQVLILWMGADKSPYTTGTVTTSRNSKSVTGSGTSWSANVSPGMFLFDNSSPQQLVGVVASVQSNTTLTLVEPALLTLAGTAYNLNPVRGIVPRVVTGEITTSTSSTTVTGTNTKFSQQFMNGSTHDIYRLSDMTFVGSTSSVTNDTSLTLSANASIALTEERYVAVPRTGFGYGYQIRVREDTSQSNPIHPVGFLTAVYARRQFYANSYSYTNNKKSSYLWFSEQDLPEAVDISDSTGDFIPIVSSTEDAPSTPIKGLAAGFNSLLICKEDETFALYGTEKEQFEVRKVFNDGVLSGMSMAVNGDLVYFAGRNGVYRWDGSEISDLTSGALGTDYKEMVKTFNPTVNRMWGTIVRDHYLLFIEAVTPAKSVTFGASASKPTRMTVCIGPSGYITYWTNVNIRGSLHLPANQAQGTWILYNTSVARIMNADNFFDQSSTGNDQSTCGGDVQGPSFYMESKRYSLGDPLRRKLLKQIAAYYQAPTDGLVIDILPGLGDVTASTNTTAFPVTASNTWVKKRLKFLKHNNFIGFRIYQNTIGAGGTSDVRFGPWQIGYKVQGPGRV